MADASAAGPQHVEADVNIVARLYEALARQDAKMLLETADPNIEWVAMEGFPHGGTKRGFEATFHEYFPSFMQYFTEWSAEPFKIRQAGDDVLAIGNYSGIIKDSEEAFTLPFAHVGRSGRARSHVFINSQTPPSSRKSWLRRVLNEPHRPFGNTSASWAKT